MLVWWKARPVSRFRRGKPRQDTTGINVFPERDIYSTAVVLGAGVERKRTIIFYIGISDDLQRIFIFYFCGTLCQIHGRVGRDPHGRIAWNIDRIILINAFLLAIDVDGTIPRHADQTDLTFRGLKLGRRYLLVQHDASVREMLH